MIDHESRLPLLIGGVVALLLHGMLVPVWGLGLTQGLKQQATQPPKQDQTLPEPPELEVGQAKKNVTNIAWIAYDDYRELLAEHSIVEQPALQKQQDPAPDAPIEFDPTPPAPNTPPTPTPAPPTSLSRDARPSESATPVSPTVPISLPAPGENADIPFVPNGPMTPDATAAAADAPKQAERDNQEAEQPPAGKPAAPDSSAKPTAAPRDEAESPPVTIMPGTLRIRPGKVETYLGVQIKTVVVRPSPAAYFSAIPRNPKARIWFNNQGIVTHVQTLRTTGAKNWDEPVRRALEQWKAKGEKIDNLEGEMQMTVELLLVGE